MPESKTTHFMKYVNSILLAFISLMLSYGVVTIQNVHKDQQEMNVAIAIMNQSLEDHLEEAAMWKARITINEEKIATTMTRAEVLAEIEKLESEIDALRNRILRL